MIDRALVTIGLPVYNAAPFLKDTLRSIFAQTFSDWELVVVDDGSSDGSIEIAREIVDDRVRILPRDGKRRGLAVRLNQIAEAARGNYLARMDSDDLMHPHRIEAQLAYLKAHPSVDLLGCGLLMVDAAMRPVAEIINPANHGGICADPVRGVRLAHATMMARTEWFRAHPYEERNFRCEDWRLLYTSRGNSRLANLPEPLYFYRVFESFSLHKYAAHKLRNLRLWCELPRAECSWARLAHLAARSFVDIGIFGVARALGSHGGLIARRGIPVGANTAEEFWTALQTIRATELPQSAKRKESQFTAD